MHAVGRQGRVGDHRAGSQFLPEFGVPAKCRLGRYGAGPLDEARAHHGRHR
jgi:hypothetical protein